MPRGKYIIPLVMGTLGQELYLIKGQMPKDCKIALAKSICRRGVIASDHAGLNKIPDIASGRYKLPAFLTEIEIIDGHGSYAPKEVKAVEGFILNTAKLSRNQSELDGWYLYERKGDLTPLKMAKFSINLIDDAARDSLRRSVRTI